jgi:hypothetical protein
MVSNFNDDVVLACVALVDRAGASRFEMGHIDEAGWYAHAQYQGARIIVDGHQSPTGAALALAERLLAGATCRCRKPVSLSDGQPGCRWRLAGPLWEPGCDAKPLPVSGGRGDYAALRRALDEPTNRAERRRKGRGR